MLKTNKFSKLIFLIIATIIMTLNIGIVFAQTETATNEDTTTTTKNTNVTVDDIVGKDLTNGPTINEMSNKLEKKGFEVVGFLQKILNPILVICLIISFIVAAIGFVSGAKHMIGYAVGALLLIGFCYIGIMFAPEMLDFMKTFIVE